MIDSPMIYNREGFETLHQNHGECPVSAQVKTIIIILNYR